MRRPVVLGVWAHPDDESYLSAALMHRVTAAGGRVHLVCATRGELGAPDTDAAVLGPRRERELRAAAAALGVHDVWFLGCADGGCADADPAPIVEHLTCAMRSARPDLVVTFGPDGITGHPDHVAVSRWVTQSWSSLPPHERGRLLYATMTHGFVARHHDEHPELPLTLHGEPHSIPDHEVALRIEPDPVERAAKHAALRAHASQTGPLMELLGEQRFLGWWTSETFRQPDHELVATAAVGVSSGRD